MPMWKVPSLLTPLHDAAVVPRMRRSEAGVERELMLRLMSEQPAAALGHAGVLAVIVTLLWTVAPHPYLLAWTAAIAAASAARLLVWQRCRLSTSPEQRRPALRIATTLVALAWGVGAALLIPHLSLAYVALLLLAISGLVAAASGTLAADLVSFRLFTFCILAPLPLVILLQGHDRFHLAAAGLTVLFGAFVVRLHLRRYRDLLEQQESARQLAISHRETRREHAFLDALFASVPNAIAVVDSEATCLTVNPGFEALFGYAAAEAIGHPIRSLIVPDAGRADAASMLELLETFGAVVMEAKRCRKDGTCITVRISAARVEGDEQERVLLLYTDMTAVRTAEATLRASQARLEMVLGSSSAVVYASRVEGASFIPQWISENLTRITGYDVEEALAPDWWYSHVHPDDRARVLAELPRLLAEDQLTVEYRFQQKTGLMRWFRDESRLVRNARGQPQDTFGVWLDITDMKAAEQAMREGRDLAERSARTRAEFLANMSHEIRTPMNAVLGLTELLLDTQLAPDQLRSLRLVQSAGETLLTLLNDILDLSKIEAEHLELESIPFDLRYLLESTVGLLAVRAVDRPIELVADVAVEVPHLVLGDPTRLRQVLSNLVGNALKFTEKGEVVVSATREGGEGERCRIRFAVRDTGIGIAADKLGSIFEEFSQADASMTRKYGGTGLGLAIARRLVGLMGGELSVTSEVGRGSEFAFAIEVPVEGERPATGDAAALLAGQRMLVVDDNATNRRIVREMLGMADVAVDEAASAAEGLESLRRAVREGQPYAVAIIDAQMPGRDGFDMAIAVRGDLQLAGTMRLLMLTSAGQQGDTQRCRDVGIEAYLMKPVSRTVLLAATAQLLGATGPTVGAEVITRHSIAEGRPRMRILLAEDNVVNQEVAASMLRKRGHTVTVVSNGREAVDAVAAQGPFDIVLMDIQMPELDGFAATREIRAGPAGDALPILALTAHALSGDRERCIAQGMNGHLPKPFRPHELFAAVEGFSSRGAVAAGEPRLELDAVRTPAPASVDLAGFRAAMREAGAEESVDRILNLFEDNVPTRMAALTAAVGAGDGVAIGRAAHAFKSPAGSIGAHGLEALLQEMELAATAGEIPRARAAFEQVGPEAESVLLCLRLSRGKESHP